MGLLSLGLLSVGLLSLRRPLLIFYKNKRFFLIFVLVFSIFVLDFVLIFR